MRNRNIAIVAVVLAIVFLVLNFTIDAGTIFLLFAAAATLTAIWMFTRPSINP